MPEPKDSTKLEEWKRKISLKLRGKIPWNKGKHLAEEHRKKLSEAGKRNLINGKRILSDETRAKMSEAQKGKKRPPEFCKRMSDIMKNKYKGAENPFYGKKHTLETINKLKRPKSKEHRYKLSQVCKGRKISEETKIKMGLSRLGKKHSLLTKQKMSESVLKRKRKQGYLNSQESRKKLSNTQKMRYQLGLAKPNYYWKDKKMSKEMREKMSLSKLGDKNHQWQGGKSFEPYGIEFNETLKEKIRKKYNYRCQQCFRHQDELFNSKGKKQKLCVHHIDYNKDNNQENNLIPLCNNCHLQTNYKRNDWVNYFQNKICESGGI